MKKEDFQNKIAWFIEEETNDEKAQKTIDAYKRVSKMFVSSLPENKEIEKQDIINFKSSIVKKYKPKTIKLYLIILNKFIKFCEVSNKDEEFELWRLKKYYSKNTVKNIKVQNIESLDDILSPTDFKRMRRMAKQQGDMQIYYILSIYAFTGIRASEIQYFTVEALTSNKDYVSVTNKGKTRQVPVQGSLRRDLLKYAKKEGIKSGEIFPISYITIYKKLKKLAGQCRGIKLELVHPHSFRHLFAYYFLDNSENNLAELADILGHGSLETTRIYLRTTIKMKKQKMEKLKY